MTASIKVSQFEVVHFTEALPDGKHYDVLILYALADGIIYELNAGKWLPLPINQSTIRIPELSVPATST